MEKNTTVGNEKILSLFDAGSFVEVGAYVKGAGSDVFCGVICGYGSVNGKLVFAFAQDMDRTKGAMDAAAAKKLKMLYDMAIKNGAPVVGMFDSCGAVVYDGSAALSAYGQWLRCVSEASGVIPQIAVVTGVCAGTAAVAASMFDITIMAGDQAELYINAPFLIGKESGKARAAAENGTIGMVCDTVEAAIAKARELAELLPSNNAECEVTEVGDVNQLLPEAISLPGDLLDAGAFTELYAAYGTDVSVGLGRLGGYTVGLVYAKAALTADGAGKAARFVEFCDSFGMPVITLVDSEGFSLNTAAHVQPVSAAYGRLASAYANASCAKITLICGAAYGAAFTLLGSKALGADLVFALPQAVISTLSPAQAVALVWNDRVSNQTPREALEKEWIEKYAAPELAAANGDVDDIIPVSELRMRLCAAVYMLAAKADGAPDRKHPVLPL